MAIDVAITPVAAKLRTAEATSQGRKKKLHELQEQLRQNKKQLVEVQQHLRQAHKQLEEARREAHTQLEEVRQKQREERNEQEVIAHKLEKEKRREIEEREKRPAVWAEHKNALHQHISPAIAPQTRQRERDQPRYLWALIELQRLAAFLLLLACPFCLHLTLQCVQWQEANGGFSVTVRCRE